MKATSILSAVALLSIPAFASSHREAPGITELPKVDGTDFYMFRSYDADNLAGTKDTTVLIANYLPLQDPYGGPNFFSLDPDALYMIHIDNDGDAVEDITFQFRFNFQSFAASASNGTEIPLVALGPAMFPGDPNLNVVELYQLTLIQGPVAAPTSTVPFANASFGTTFFCPPCYYGRKSLLDYENNFIPPHLFSLVAPIGGRCFAGQRSDPFAVNLGEIFDLVNLNPLGARNAEQNTLARKNVMSMILEVETADLLAGGDGSGIIGGWTTAWLPRDRTLVNNPPPGLHNQASHSGPMVQVSRLGMPLVNELIIGMSHKDAFNNSHPVNDAASPFPVFAEEPSMAAILNTLFGTGIADVGRSDLVDLHFQGLAGLNRPPVVVGSEMLRLNTTIPPVDPLTQDPYGVIGGDRAGFPNGRRLGDDVVDIALQAISGSFAGGGLPLTDGADINATHFADKFPYLGTPHSPSPDDMVCLEIHSNLILSGPFSPVTGPILVDDVNDTVAVSRTPGADREFFRGESNVSLKLEVDSLTPSQIGLKVRRNE